MKKILILILFVLLAAIGYCAYVFLTLDPEELGRRVLAKTKESTGIEVMAASFAVRPLKGIELEQGRLEARLEAGYVEGDLERLFLDYQLLPMLKGDVVVKRIDVERPNLEIVSQSARTLKVEDAEGGGIPTKDDATETGIGLAKRTVEIDSRFISEVSIAEIRVTDGQIRWHSGGTTSGGLAIRGLDFDLRNLTMDASSSSTLLGLAGEGAVRVERIDLDGMSIRSGRGALMLDRGRLVVTNLGIETTHASLEVAELVTDLSVDPPPYRVKTGGSYDLAALVGAVEDGFGAASLELSAHGRGSGLDQVRGRGTFRVEDGRVPSFPVIAKLEELLGTSLIVGMPYEGAEIAISIAGGSVEIEPFVIGFENLQLAAGGRIDLSGPVDLQIDVKLPREAVSIQTLEPFMQRMTDGDGWTIVPFSITGTLVDPAVEFDMIAIEQRASEAGNRAVRRALEEAAESLRDQRRRGKVPGDSS